MNGINAADLPVGSRVTTKNGEIYIRDRRGAQGWWRYPHGFYYDHEIDKLLADDAAVQQGPLPTVSDDPAHRGDQP